MGDLNAVPKVICHLSSFLMYGYFENLNQLSTDCSPSPASQMGLCLSCKNLHNGTKYLSTIVPYTKASSQLDLKHLQVTFVKVLSRRGLLLGIITQFQLVDEHPNAGSP